MAFSTRTVTHKFSNADGTPASGNIAFDLSKRMTNDGSTILPSTVHANLDNTGAISQVLAANNDTDTVPTDAQWRVTLHILGADEEQFFITVPAGSGSVDLGSLLPSTPQVN